MAMKLPTFLLLIFIAAFSVRAVAVVALRNVHTGPDSSFGADGKDFDAFATSMAEGRGYGWSPNQPTSFRAPGFPLLLAAIYATAGRHYPLVYVVFCAIGAAACVLTYAVASELLAERTARWAAILSVFYVPDIYFATEFASESLFVLLLALATWLFLRSLRTASIAALAIAAISLGFGVLTRPFALLLVPLFAGVLCWQLWRLHSSSWIRVALFLGLCLLAIAPWTWRNYRVHHHLVLVATNGGSTFYGANNDRVLHDRWYRGGWIS